MKKDARIFIAGHRGMVGKQAGFQAYDYNE